MKNNEALFSLIKERPDPNLSWNEAVCPSCSSKELTNHYGESTCLGWFPRVPEDDTPDCPGNPNLTSNHYTCNTCGLEFVYRVKYGNIWVKELLRQLESIKILKGLPNVHSGKYSVYTCAYCGEVAVKVEENEKKYKHIVAPPDLENPPYKIVCTACKKSVESKYDCYQHPYTYKNAFHGVRGPIKIYTKPGVSIANSRAIQKGLPK